MAVTRAEFEDWSKSFVDTFKQVLEILDKEPVDHEALLDQYEIMEIDLDVLENFRPKGNAKPPYDYTQIIPSIASYKRSRPKILRVLKNNGHTIDVKPIVQPNDLPASRKIPDIVVENFTGDIVKYQSFKSTFQMKYAGLPISDGEKLAHLKNHTTGPPRLLIQNLELTDENYDIACQLLANEYERPDTVISTLYKRIDDLPIAGKSPEEMQTTYFQLEGFLSALRAHNELVDGNPSLRNKVMAKYPYWLVRAAVKGEIPSVTRFQKLISAEILLAKNLAEACGYQSKFTGGMNQIPKSTVAMSNGPKKQEGQQQKAGIHNKKTSDRPLSCLFCAEEHYSAQCQKFPTLDERLPLITKRCQKCLNQNHSTESCTRKLGCRYCKGDHNSAVCPKEFASKKPQLTDSNPQRAVNIARASSENTSRPNTPSSSVQQPSPDLQRSVNFTTRSRGALNTFLAQIKNEETGTYSTIRCLFDQGADDTYISEQATRRFGLPTKNRFSVPVKAFMELEFMMKSAETKFTLSDGKKFQLEVTADTTPKATSDVRLFDYQEFLRTYPEYSNLKFVDSGHGTPIDVIIGNDYLYDFIFPETKITVTPGLHLVNTTFGYILTGRRPTGFIRNQNTMLHVIQPSVAIDKLSSLDGIGITDTTSELKNEQLALDQFYENLRFKNDRYEIRWPWRKFPPDLVNNYGQARGHLKSQLCRMSEEDFRAYDSIIDQQIQSGIVERVPVHEKQKTEAFYLPHHPIYTPEKSTPLRIVYNGSAKPNRTQPSLNEQLFKGKNLLTDMTSILIRFRFHPVAMVSDLEKCFHQLSIHPMDRNWVRFLWINDFSQPVSEENLEILRFTRTAFGIVSSPFLSNAVIFHHLQKYENKFFTNRDIYVDNIITGSPDVDTAKQLHTTAVQIFRKCSMNLRGWASSSEEIRKFFPTDLKENKNTISILGLKWNQTTDLLNIAEIEFEDHHTLRTVLSTVAAFFDPCGWFAPLSIAAKIFMQTIRKADLGWDDPLPVDLKKEWLRIRNNLKQATHHTIPRFQTVLEGRVEIHCFADASQKAYACAAYLRVMTKEDTKTYLICARSKVAPLKSNLTIPKLELLAAVIGARLIQFLKKEIKVSKSYLWLDSKCAIFWIIGAKIQPTFIENRVREIRQLTETEIRYVPTHQNPADLPSRGSSYNELQSLWWKGPDFLRTDEFPPTPSINQLDDPEPEVERNLMTKTTIVEKIIPFEISEKFQKYVPMLNVSAMVIKFLRLKKCLPKTTIFDAANSDRTIARHLWIRAEQRNFYPDVLQALQQGKTSQLINDLNLFTGDDGILRCRGRLRYAPLTTEEKNPMLLPTPKKSPFTRAFIDYVHESHFHSGTNHTLNAVRRSVWIPSGRAEIYHQIRKCVKCKKFTTFPYAKELKSDLPDFRLAQTEVPFKNIGLDTFGHIYISRQKRYVLIIVDMVIRAIELEPLRSMKADDLCLAFRNVAARRTIPDLAVSDNAAQINLLKQNLKNDFSQVDWKFIPEKASWMAGAYERLIRLVKNAFYRTFQYEKLTDSLFRTTLYEIAAVVNSRPLTYLPNTTEDLPLTPNHFLMARFPPTDQAVQILPSTTTASHVQHLWKRANQLLEVFWKDWATNYLNYLRERPAVKTSSTRTSSASPQVGEVVLIAEPHIKRNNWRLGRIETVIVSADGVVRSANIKTKHGIITRPVGHLYPLELDDDQKPSSADPEIEEEVIEIDTGLDF